MNEQPKFLKCLRNGRKLAYSPTLATREDMVPCDSDGKVLGGHVGDAQAGVDTMNRKVTKFLGNVANGRLFPYTPFLAEREDLVSIESEAQWKGMLNPDAIPESIEPVEGFSLDRRVEGPGPGDEPKDLDTEKVVDIKPDTTEKPAIQLPDIDGLSKKDAKAKLDEWAKGLGRDLDRRKSLEDLIVECKAIVSGSQ